jgi:hypothetical protein
MEIMIDNAAILLFTFCVIATVFRATKISRVEKKLEINLQRKPANKKNAE